MVCEILRVQLSPSLAGTVLGHVWSQLTALAQGLDVCTHFLGPFANQEGTQRNDRERACTHKVPTVSDVLEHVILALKEALPHSLKVQTITSHGHPALAWANFPVKHAVSALSKLAQYCGQIRLRTLFILAALIEAANLGLFFNTCTQANCLHSVVASAKVTLLYIIIPLLHAIHSSLAS